MTAEQLQAARAAHWRQQGNPLLTLEEAEEWLGLHPLCLFLPRPAQLPAPAPSLVEACLGRREATPGPDAIRAAQQMLTRLMAKGTVVGLNLLGAVTEQPDFLAQRDALPYVLCLRADPDWKQAPKKSSGHKVSPLVLELWKVLEEPGARTADEAREALGRELTEAAVLRALCELWQGLRIIPVASGEDRPPSWEMLRVKHRAALTQAAATSQVTALSLLVSMYLQSVYAASSEEIEIFLSPVASRSRVREAVRGLAATRQVQALSMDAQTYYFLENGLPEFALGTAVAAVPVEGPVEARSSPIFRRPRPEVAGGARQAKPPAVGRPAWQPTAGAPPWTGKQGDQRAGGSSSAAAPGKQGSGPLRSSRPYAKPASPTPGGGRGERPGARWDARPSAGARASAGTGSRPAARPGSKPGGRPDSKLSARPDSRPRPGARPDSRPGARPDWRPVARPGARPDGRPGARPDSRPGGRPQSRPGARPDSRPDARPDARPSGRPDTRPGARPDARPGVRADSRPRPGAGSRPGAGYRQRDTTPRPWALPGRPPRAAGTKNRPPRAFTPRDGSPADRPREGSGEPASSSRGAGRLPGTRQGPRFGAKPGGEGAGSRPAKASPNRPPSYGKRPGPGTSRRPGAGSEGRPGRGPGYQRARPSGDPKAGTKPRPERRPGTAGEGRPSRTGGFKPARPGSANFRRETGPGRPGKPANGSRDRQPYRKPPGV